MERGSGISAATAAWAFVGIDDPADRAVRVIKPASVSRWLASAFTIMLRPQQKVRYHLALQEPCPFANQEQTFASVNSMSAKCHKRTSAVARQMAMTLYAFYGSHFPDFDRLYQRFVAPLGLVAVGFRESAKSLVELFGLATMSLLRFQFAPSWRHSLG